MTAEEALIDEATRFMEAALNIRYSPDSRATLALYIHCMRSQHEQYKRMCDLAQFFRQIAEDLEDKYRQGPMLPGQ